MSDRSHRSGYRGYIASRAIRGTVFPQHVQNLVVRDYAQRRGLRYLLSATEYAMPSCYMMLHSILEELVTLEGLIFFSMFMLPLRRERRQDVYDRVFAAGCELHAALEGISLRRPSDVIAIEDTLAVALTLPRLPMGGRYEKDENSPRERELDPFWAELRSAL